LFQRVTKNENGFFLGHDMLSVRAVDVLISKKFVRQTDWREEGGRCICRWRDRNGIWTTQTSMSNEYM